MSAALCYNIDSDKDEDGGGIGGTEPQILRGGSFVLRVGLNWRLGRLQRLWLTLQRRLRTLMREDKKEYKAQRLETDQAHSNVGRLITPSRAPTW